MDDQAKLIVNQAQMMENQSQMMQEMKNIILQLSKTNPELTINNNTINVKTNTNNVSQSNTINNNTTNITVFLNEQCGNAMNFIDFSKKILADKTFLADLREIGFTDAFTKIITKSLNDCSIYNRPIHYEKNEDNAEENKIHIRDNNKWNIEQGEHTPIIDNVMAQIDERMYGQIERLTKNEFQTKRLLKDSSFETIQQIKFNILEAVLIDQEIINRDC